MRSLQDFDGMNVLDAAGQRIGTVERSYDDQSGKTRLIGVTTGHLLTTKHRLVPVDGVTVTDQGLQVPYDRQTIDNSPDASAAGDALDSALVGQVQTYYETLDTAQNEQPSITGGEQEDESGDGATQATSELKEEAMNSASSVTPEQLMNYDLIDNEGNKVGSMDGVWTDPASGNLAFLGVKTIPLVGKTYVIPADQAQVDSSNQTVTVPYGEDTIKNAPTSDPNRPIPPSAMNTIQTYYQQAQDQQAASTEPVGAVPVTSTTRTGSSSTLANSPVDNLTYDLYTLIAEKLRGLEAYSEYIKDAGSDETTANLLRQLSQQDVQGVQQLQQALVRRLTGQSTT